jgi:hypothetical protein
VSEKIPAHLRFNPEEKQDLGWCTWELCEQKEQWEWLNHCKTKRLVKSREQTQTDPATQPGFPKAKVKSQTQLKIKRGTMNGTREIKTN